MTSLAEHWYDEGRLGGIKFGEVLGIEKGIEKGIVINKIETARNLLPSWSLSDTLCKYDI